MLKLEQSFRNWNKKNTKEKQRISKRVLLKNIQLLFLHCIYFSKNDKLMW